MSYSHFYWETKTENYPYYSLLVSKDNVFILFRQSFKGYDYGCESNIEVDSVPFIRTAIVHLNFRAWSTFPVPVYTVSPGHWVNKADTQKD